MFPQLFGKYVLERELAAGGMARVYLATLRGAVGFEKKLVVKQIRPELASDAAFVRRFVEEAKTAVELSHPNIVPVYELGVEQGVYYIAMELCAGLTLAEVLQATGKLTPEEGAHVGVEICRALDYAHRRAAIVHRDVTPRNVLIDEEGAVRLIDFGIAAPVDPGADHSGEVFGSPGHMPPEQVAGKVLTPAADVFALATLLVEAWTGHPPFRRETARASREALNSPVPPLDQDDPELSPLADPLASCLERDVENRPAEVDRLGRPLRDFLRGFDIVEVSRRLGARVRRAARTSRPDRPSQPGAAAGSGASTGPKTPGAPSRTFAARNEVVEWTRNVQSEPPPAKESGPSTRKLPSESPSVAPRAGSSAAPAARGRRATVVVLALMLAGVLVALLGRTGRAPPPSALSAAKEPAARPEAGALSDRASLSRSADGTPADGAPAPSQVAPPPGPAGSAGPTLPASGAPPERPARPAPGTGVLRLTADPPATVSVHGAGKTRSLSTPVRALKLPAGPYTVTFQSPTYSAPVVARVIVEAAAPKSVHADFREAVPRVTVR